ncbi:MAG TPA: amino acid adenylation domain-containing protein, partial [Pyrinomonadaceae bacterium]
ERDQREDVPIGRAGANMHVYVLDEARQMVGEGVVGEVYIGGEGLAAGYLGREELTREKFVEHPYEEGGRLYRSGDLGRRLAGGVLEYLGRRDEQVKYHGYRVELNEIRSALNEHPQVRDSVVAIMKDHQGTDVMVGYYVSRQEIDGGELRARMGERIIEATIPSIFVHLKKLPLTINGKINYDALPSVKMAKEQVSRVHVAARTPIEEGLAGVWSEVLGISRVSIHDNFFVLGGHSLLATQVLSHVREIFQVELPLRALFEQPTVAELAGRVETLMRAGHGIDSPPIQPVARDAALPLSFAQQRLWFLDQLQSGNTAYLIPAALRLKGQLNIAALEQTFSEIIRRHEVLRTAFAQSDGSPVQVISAPEPLSLPSTDLSRLTEAEQDAEVRRLTAEEAQRPFDLSHGPLLRARLLRLGAEDHVLLFTMHHIICDGWSIGLMINEVAVLYKAFIEGKPSPLAELPIQYADYAQWQREWLRGELLDAKMAYWKNQLDGAPPVLELPADRPRPQAATYNGAIESLMLSQNLSEELAALSRREGVTLFMTLLAAFQTLLYRYTAHDDIVVGSPIAGRNRAEIENLIGFFINTLVLRTDLSGNPNFKELLGRVREVALGAYAHQDVPFEMLVEELQPERFLNHSPLFQVVFVLQNAPVMGLELPGLSLSSLPVESGVAPVDLHLNAVSTKEGLVLSFGYNTDLFEAVRIRRMLEHFRQLLEGVASDPVQRLSQLPLLTAAEQQQLLVEWNDTAIDYSENQLAHRIFEQQAERNPDAVALIFGDESLSYSELNQRANQLAHHLMAMGVTPEMAVAICMERSIEMIVSMLAVLKAGGAYLPLDLSLPSERLAFMLEAAAVPLILTKELASELLPATWGQVICVDTEWESISALASDNPAPALSPDNLAYLIYTSGSTGRPKAVLLSHRGLSNLALSQAAAFAVSPLSRVLQFASPSFDASVSEVFMALTSGAALSLGTADSLFSASNLLELLRHQRITTVTLPPALLSVLPDADLPELSVLIAAGESCPPEVLQRWGAGRRFFNAYGPTETTVCATLGECDAESAQIPPIGRPLANMRVYVLDNEMGVVAAGVTGELYVSGVGLARGYMNE